MTSEVDERLEGLGEWTIDLEGDLSRQIFDRLTLDENHPQSLGAATLVVTDTHIDAAALGDTSTSSWHPLTELGRARYCGVLTQITGRRRTLKGHGLAWHLGTPDDNGELFGGAPMPGTIATHNSRPFVLAAGDYIDWLVEGGTRASSDVVPTNVTIRGSHLVGSDTPLTGPATPFFTGLFTRRDQIDKICEYAGWVWYVRPDGLVRAGTPASLFSGDRAVIATGITPDPAYVTVNTTADGIDWDEDMSGWSNAAAHFHEKDDTRQIWQQPHGTIDAFYLGPDLEPLLHSSIEAAESDETSADWVDRMEAENPARTQVRRQVKIAGQMVDHGVHLRMGEPVWVYEPDVGLEDTANEIYVAGLPIHPVALPLHGLRWPVVDGMGVYVVFPDRVAETLDVLDLTDHVSFADGDTTVTVGAPSWTL